MLLIPNLLKLLLILTKPHVVVVSTHSIYPCLWRESDHPAFGPPASISLHLASSTNPGVTVYVRAVEEIVCVVCVLQRGHSGDRCDLASTLCKYDLRKGDLFDLSWARVRRGRRESPSSELLMCGGGVRSILLLPLVAS